MMYMDEKPWLTLSEASDRLGVHPATLRRWTEAGQIPCVRTPGGHRRFRSVDIAAWTRTAQETALTPQAEALVLNAVGYTRQLMAQEQVSSEAWYAAFNSEEDRGPMRDTGRRLFGLAIQYMSRTHDHEPILKEGRRIGESYGQMCGQRGVSLVDTVRALFFFRESLLRAAKPGQVSPGQYDAEDVRIHRQLRHFLDEVMYGCLASYEATRLRLLAAGSES